MASARAWGNPLLTVSRYCKFCYCLGNRIRLVEIIERSQKMATKSPSKKKPSAAKKSAARMTVAKKTTVKRMTKPHATKTAAMQKASIKPLSQRARIEETQTKLRAKMRAGGIVGRVKNPDTNKLKGLGPVIVAARKYWKGVDRWVAKEFPKWQPANRRRKTA